MERTAARCAPATPVAGVPRPRGKRTDLPGEVRETRRGPVLVCARNYPASYRHGRVPAEGYRAAGDALAVLAADRRLAGLAPEGALFLDTETTGLSGGTGTLPFLVGLGWLEVDGRFCVEQLFCRDPSEEAAQLELLADRLGRSSHLITFNGRAFDMPLVNTRFVMNGIRNPGFDLPHLDLLHVARRVFGRRLSDRSLKSLESAVLGFEREGDIPGHAIPGAYVDYLRGGPPDSMAAVLDHNAWDLVALAALGSVLEEMYRSPEAVEHAADQLGLARAALAAGEEEAASGHLAHASATGGEEEGLDARRMAARAAARRRDHQRAADLWADVIRCRPGDGEAHLSLAKHFEHRARDLERALHHALLSSGAENDEASAHRVARIERKRKRRDHG